MTFDEFKEEVAGKIKDYLPKEYQDAKVDLTDVIKNNDTHLTGITLRTEESGIAPTLYLNDYYDVFTNMDYSMEDVLTRIAETYDHANKHDMSKEVKDTVKNVTDYDATKAKILPRIVNLESNEERLQGMPHTQMGDLAVTYHVDLGSQKDGQMSIAISNPMMEQYGISVEELHEQACKNMEEVSPSKFETIVETLASLMIPGYEEMSFEEKEQARYEFDMPDPGMYVLTNDSKVFGAAAMLDSKTMDTIREQVGDFYILPSSVHEVLIVPKKEDLKLEELETMVQEVNATQVAPNEVLSDHVYEYDAETKEIFRADKAEEHQKAKEANKEKRPSLKEKLEEKKKESKELAKNNKTQEKTKEKGRE